LNLPDGLRVTIRLARGHWAFGAHRSINSLHAIGTHGAVEVAGLVQTWFAGGLAIDGVDPLYAFRSLGTLGA
jgi:hypothetical protein